MQKPLPEEHVPYFKKYIDLVSDAPFFDVLQQNTGGTIQFFRHIPEEKHNFRYAPDKWTVKDTLMHLIDTERGMSFRALVAARGDSEMPLYPLDENLFASNVDTSQRSMQTLLAEFAAVRAATELLLMNITEEQTKWTCNSNGHKTTPRAFGYMIIGHVIHHLNLIQERYLV